MDPHHNIFFYYHGPSTKTKKEGHGRNADDKQLEDNTTKALINVLRLTYEHDRGRVLRKFLRDCCDIGKKDFDKVEFHLQVGQEASRPDARIEFYNNHLVYALLIESKIDAELFPEQLVNHIRDQRKTSLLAITRREDDKKTVDALKDDNVTFCSWRKVYEIFRQLLNNETSEVNKLLITQFTEYLAMNSIVLDPLRAGFESAVRLEQLQLLVNGILQRIKTEPRFSSYRSLLVRGKKFSNYVGIRIGNGKAHYNVNFQPQQIGIDLTLFKVKLTEKGEERLKEYCDGKFATVKAVIPRKVTKEQSKLMRYCIGAVGYRSLSKGETDEAQQTFKYELNFYEVKMNLKEEKKKRKLLDDLFNAYKKASSVGTAKQIDLSFRIRVPREMNVGRRKQNRGRADIRYLDKELLEHSDLLVKELTDFVFETIPIANHFGLKKYK
jgi:hypothetical protein